MESKKQTPQARRKRQQARNLKKTKNVKNSNKKPIPKQMNVAMTRPMIVTNPSSNKFIKMSKNGDVAVVKHQQVYGTGLGSSEWFCDEFLMEFSDAVAFPWISQVVKLYDVYTVLQLKFIWVPTIGPTYPRGMYYLAFDPDPNDIKPKSFSEFANISPKSNVAFTPWTRTELVVPPEYTKKLFKKHFTHSQQNTDINSVFCGKLYWASDQCADQTALGTLYSVVTLKLETPTIPTSPPALETVYYNPLPTNPSQPTTAQSGIPFGNLISVNSANTMWQWINTVLPWNFGSYAAGVQQQALKFSKTGTYRIVSEIFSQKLGSLGYNLLAYNPKTNNQVNYPVKSSVAKSYNTETVGIATKAESTVLEYIIDVTQEYLGYLFLPNSGVSFGGMITLIAGWTTPFVSGVNQYNAKMDIFSVPPTFSLTQGPILQKPHQNTPDILTDADEEMVIKNSKKTSKSRNTSRSKILEEDELYD